MRTITPLGAVVYGRWGDDLVMVASYDPEDRHYPFNVAWGEDGDFDSFSLDHLRKKAEQKRSEAYCNVDHDNEDDDDWYDRDECEECNSADEADAWEYIYNLAAAAVGGEKIVNNLSTVAHAVLGSDDTWNHAALYPQARAVFSFDADRLTIRNAVIRAMESQGIAQGQIDQFSYEADTSPDVLAVAQRWVTCS